MRGALKFKRLLEIVEPKANIDINYNLRRGRSVDLIIKRNECLFYRYYYYLKIHRLRYEDVMAKLVNEFSISTHTIVNIINTTDNIDEVFNEKLNLASLKKKYDFLIWKSKS